jgi:hypothetical protein
METYSERLSTFASWTRTDISPHNLAAHGFYFANGLTQCFCCGLVVQRWELLAQPWFEHAREAPECSYLRSILPENRILMAFKRWPWNTAFDFLRFQNPSNEQYQAWTQYMARKGLVPCVPWTRHEDFQLWRMAKQMDTVLSTRSYQTYEYRWTTLKDLPHSTPEMQESLARCGYHLVNSRVECEYCHWTFDPLAIKEDEQFHSSDCAVSTWRNNLYFTRPQG